MSPRRAAGLLGAGRAALGAAVLAAPEAVTSHWLGEENASHPAVRYLARSLGARDLALGVLALRTLDDARVASQVQAACAVADAVDALATVAVARAAAARRRRSARSPWPAPRPSPASYLVARARRTPDRRAR